jgi:hypothetical protein
MLCFAGVTLILPEELDFPNTMTDIDYDTWMLRFVILVMIKIIPMTFLKHCFKFIDFFEFTREICVHMTNISMNMTMASWWSTSH